MDMVGRDDLTNAVALNALLFNVARVLGPALGGLSLVWLGPAWCFLLNGLSYFAVLWALAAMDLRESARPAGAGRGPHGLFSGFAYLAGRPRLAFLILLAGAVALFGWPFSSLLPALVQRSLGGRADAYSLLLSGTGCGALTAALTVAAFSAREGRRGFIGAGVVIVTLALLGLSGARTLPVAITCCALIGYGLILFLATTQAVVQLGADDWHRGRVMGVWAMILSGAIPLGNLLAGFAADRWGEPRVLCGEGLACVTTALALRLLLGVLVREQGPQLSPPRVPGP
jgi:MFS family permease